MISGAALAYIFLGFVSALVVVELTDGKPAKKIAYTNIEHEFYVEEPWAIQDTPQQDTFNSQRNN